MNVRQLKDIFASIGARVMVEPARELWQEPGAARMEVCQDHRGGYFHLMIDPLRVITIEAGKSSYSSDQIEVIVRQRAFGRMSEASRQRFLCSRFARSIGVVEVVDAVSN
jgi:hypothetical protein